MSRLRRHLVPLLLMLPVIFICGKLLLTPVIGQFFGKTRNNYDSGWPWVFRNATYDTSTPGITKVTVEQFSIWLLLGDIAVLVAVILASWWILSELQRRSAGWRQFSLRGLLVLVTLVAIACGWWMSNSRQLNLEQRLERQLNEYSDAHESLGPFRDITAGREFCGPQWVRRFVSNEVCQKYFFRIAELWIVIRRDEAKSFTMRSTALEVIPQLAHLRSLKITLYDIENAGDSSQRFRIRNPAALQRIESIKLDLGAADDETVSALGNLHNLKSLEFVLCPISHKAIDELERCKNLEKLSIFRFSETSVSRFPVLSNLKELYVDGVTISPAAFDTLIQLKSLRRLTLPSKGFTDEMVRRLVQLRELEYLQLTVTGQLSSETVQLLKRHIAEVSVQ
jgi:hypothetical protein